MTAGLHAELRMRRGDAEIDVELAVRPGETVAIVGPNGSGKSTVLQCLAGILRPEAGAIALDGAALLDTDAGLALPPASRRVGVVFSEHLLFSHLTVLDNVAFGPRSRGAGRAGSRAAARDLLTRMRLDAFADRLPATLSGGQSQRVALARALATEPALLLLDEPLAALDVEVRGEVLADLAEHLAAFGGSTVLVTHSLRDLRALASEVVVLDAGRVAQCGTRDEVLAAPATPFAARLAAGELG